MDRVVCQEHLGSMVGWQCGSACLWFVGISGDEVFQTLCNEVERTARKKGEIRE